MNKRSSHSIEESDREYLSFFETINDGLIISDRETHVIVEANPAACRMHGYLREELIGMQLSKLIHANSLDLFQNYLRAFQPETAFDLQTIHVRHDGSAFSSEWHGNSFIYGNRPCLLSIVRDVSERVYAEQELQKRIENHSREQATLLEISHTLASTLEFQPGLILDQLFEIVEYSHGGLLALKDSAFVPLALRGTPQLEQLSTFRILLGAPETLSTLFNDHQSIRISDVGSDNADAKFLRLFLAGGTDLFLKGMVSFMWTPLAVKNRLIGGVVMAHTKPNYFTPHHADLSLSVANQAAITMINAQLYADAQTLAVLEERQRLARNLHDAVNQSLFSAGLIAEVLPRVWERDQEEARRSLEDLRNLIRGALSEMRALLAELRPTTLTDAEIGDLLRLLSDAFTGRTNIPSTVTVVGKSVLPSGVQVAIYRICQEVLNNVAKHSGASKVETHLSHQDGAVELVIRDDGKGFDPEQSVSGHYGLSMMQERAKAAGVHLLIASQPGQGTKVTIRWTKTAAKEVE